VALPCGAWWSEPFHRLSLSCLSYTNIIPQYTRALLGIRIERNFLYNLSACILVDSSVIVAIYEKTWKAYFLICMRLAIVQPLLRTDQNFPL
jgi:hypothetical protein